MAKFNSYFLLKYSEHRSQLQVLPFSTVENFCSLNVYEVTYPVSFKGPQTKYFGPSTCFDNLPSGCVIKKLSSSELRSLYFYYQLGKFLTNL